MNRPSAGCGDILSASLADHGKMKLKIIGESAIERRRHWLTEIVSLSGKFGADATRVEDELNLEIQRDGAVAVLDHLRLCGNIPEQYGHDSSEEKLYSKYTDVVLAAALRQIGLKAQVLTERGDAADVEAVADEWSMVGDAKAFRLSRTAINPKDLKIEALDGWKRGKTYALLACPGYKMPMRGNRIYQDAISRNVAVVSYAHLTSLVALAERQGAKVSTAALLAILQCAEAQSPTQDALFYWTMINRTLLSVSKHMSDLWRDERAATLEALTYAKEEALNALAREREAALRMTHDEAVRALMKNRKFDGRISVISATKDNGMLGFK
jgi:HindIII restriction endonuclease